MEKTSYKTENKELMALSVYNVGFQKCEPDYKWGPGIRDHYIIHQVVSGKGKFVIHDKEYNLSSGDCFIIFPHAEVSYSADSSDPWEYVWIGFDGPDAGLVLNTTDFTRDAPFIRNVKNGDRIKETILEVYNSRGNGFINTIRMTGLLYELLSYFVEEADKEPVASTAKIYVQSAVKYISENYSYPISIEDIALYIGISRSQLFRCFDSVYGLSPKEYLTDFRIKQACHLLEETDFSMTAIANSLGFDNSLYFSKAFHKAKGKSPSEYRKEKKN